MGFSQAKTAAMVVSIHGRSWMVTASVTSMDTVTEGRDSGVHPQITMDDPWYPRDTNTSERLNQVMQTGKRASCLC